MSLLWLPATTALRGQLDLANVWSIRACVSSFCCSAAVHGLGVVGEPGPIGACKLQVEVDVALHKAQLCNQPPRNPAQPQPCQTCTCLGRSCHDHAHLCAQRQREYCFAVHLQDTRDHDRLLLKICKYFTDKILVAARRNASLASRQMSQHESRGVYALYRELHQQLFAENEQIYSSVQ